MRLNDQWENWNLILIHIKKLYTLFIKLKIRMKIKLTVIWNQKCIQLVQSYIVKSVNFTLQFVFNAFLSKLKKFKRSNFYLIKLKYYYHSNKKINDFEVLK